VQAQPVQAQPMQAQPMQAQPTQAQPMQLMAVAPTCGGAAAMACEQPETFPELTPLSLSQPPPAAAAPVAPAEAMSQDGTPTLQPAQQPMSPPPQEALPNAAAPPPAAGEAVFVPID